MAVYDLIELYSSQLIGNSFLFCSFVFLLLPAGNHKAVHKSYHQVIRFHTISDILRIVL